MFNGGQDARQQPSRAAADSFAATGAAKNDAAQQRSAPANQGYGNVTNYNYLSSQQQQGNYYSQSGGAQGTQQNQFGHMLTGTQGNASAQQLQNIQMMMRGQQQQQNFGFQGGNTGTFEQAGGRGFVPAQQQQYRQPVYQQQTQSSAFTPQREQWIEAKDSTGRAYWYNPRTSQTHWYDPGLVEVGIQMIRKREQPPQHILEHLKRYKWEKYQSTGGAPGGNTATSSSAVANQGQTLEERQKYERQRMEAMQLSRQKQQELELKRAQEKAADDKLAQERYAKLKKEAPRKSKALLRKFLDSIGYSTYWVTESMLMDAIRFVEPTERADEFEREFESAAAFAIEHYQKADAAMAEKKRTEETRLMTLEDVNINFAGTPKASAGISAEARKERLKLEFEEFFKFKSAKMLGKNDWKANAKKTEAEAPAAIPVPKKRKREEPPPAVGRRPKRQTRSRLMQVEGHMVLKSNNYGMDESVQSNLKPVDLRKNVKPARSAFIFFSSETSQLLKREDPSLTFRDMQKQVSERWRVLDPSRKAVYMEKAKMDKTRVAQELYAAADQELKNKEFNANLVKEQLEKEQLIKQAREESAQLEQDVRRSGRTGGGTTPTGKGPPRPQYMDIIDAAVISLGPRAGVSPENVADWVKQTKLGRLFLGRLKAEYDSSFLQKTMKKGLNKMRYTCDSRRGYPREISKLKLAPQTMKNFANALTYKEIKEAEKLERATAKGLSFTASRLQRQHDVEKARTEHREAMKEAIFESNQKKWAFMYRHKDMILPFVDDTVKEKLEHAATLLREMGKGDWLENDPSGYEQEDKQLEELHKKKTEEEKLAKESTQAETANGSEPGTPSNKTIDLNNRRKRPTCLQPANIEWGELRPYQMEGLRWLVSTFENGINAILADEMGLGKTLQTISFLTHLKFEMNVGGPFLVIVPLSVLTAWANEFQRWSPDMKVIKLHSSSKEERDRLKRDTLSDFSKFDVVITTFEMIISNNMKNLLSNRMWWRYVVIDEGHKIKNDETDLSIAVRAINCQGRLLLTGTPLQNNLHELWALLNYLYPSMFTSSEQFDQCFDLAKQIVERDMLEKAHYLIRPFVLRRTKGEVEQRMPAKEEIEVKVPLSPMQKHWYKMLLMRDAKLLQRVEASISTGGGDGTNPATGGESAVSDWKKLQSLMMQLRKCCNHPYLFPNAEPAFDGTTKEDIVEASGKLKMLDRLLKRLHENGHRVVIFSQFTATLDILQDFCSLRGYKFSRLDGSTNRVQRAIDIMQYNKEDSTYFAYLMSTRAGGLGINLATADTVILYDSDWNPQVDLQAMDRVHRIGQTKPVHVYRLIAKGTVEERVVQRAKKKLYLDKMVNRGSTSQAEALESLSKAEMLKMLKFGATAVVGGENDSDERITDEQLSKMMDRSKLDGKEDGEVDEETPADEQELNALDFDGTQDNLDIRELNGVTYSKSPTPGEVSQPIPLPAPSGELSLKEIAEQWAKQNPDLYGSKPKRARVSRYVEVDGHTILKANNYSLQEGEKSVFSQELGSRAVTTGVPPGHGRQIAGRDYENEGHCLACWDGGELLLCDQCCASYHEHCLRADQLPAKKKNRLSGSVTWGCPHHSCKICLRKAHASGGMLFRCTECPNAFCEDHLPIDDAHLNENGRELRFEELGQRKPAQAYFIQCSPNCARFAQTRIQKGAMAAIKEATALREKEARAAKAAKLEPPVVADEIVVQRQQDQDDTVGFQARTLPVPSIKIARPAQVKTENSTAASVLPTPSIHTTVVAGSSLEQGAVLNPKVEHDPALADVPKGASGPVLANETQGQEHETTANTGSSYNPAPALDGSGSTLDNEVQKGEVAEGNSNPEQKHQAGSDSTTNARDMQQPCL
uniref:Uncharacterized protein n=1 Tax=Mucochytrium quahogii TaxID=96639 RepID=A0A7S2WMT9_9STRA|mmetsp:Transcript_4811/g.8725  ORF Transcript_4811/g.8725 Transcript_4811/m.8725 type:complete len:1865 (-) Transcript_4811:3365-8959(-)